MEDNAIKYCPNCGKKIPAKARKCKYCGVWVENYSINNKNNNDLENKKDNLININQVRNVESKSVEEKSTINNNENSSTNSTKLCPYCYKEIHIDTKKCPHCGEWLKSKYSNKSELKDKNMKLCPFCCREVPKDAQKCTYCGEWLVEPDIGPNMPFRVFSTICAIIFVIVVCTICSSGSVIDDDALFGLVFGVGIMYFIYFLPTIVADSRRHSKTTLIFMINLFFGETFIGWVIAFIWACCEENKQKKLHHLRHRYKLDIDNK